MPIRPFRHTFSIQRLETTASILTIAVALFASLPHCRILEFRSGVDCTTAVGGKTCPDSGSVPCTKTFEKCNVGSTKIAVACDDGQGSDSPCKDDSSCIHIKNASYDTNCDTPTTNPPDAE